MAQLVKNLPTMQETQVQSLVWEDPLEKKMTTNSNILAWETPWTEEPGYSPQGCTELDMTEQLNLEKEMATHSSVLEHLHQQDVQLRGRIEVIALSRVGDIGRVGCGQL